jgi:quercetin dioxygenase-like cupin family protein
VVDVTSGAPGAGDWRDYQEQRNGRLAEQPLTICDWAIAEGIEHGIQHLGIDMSPGQIRVPKTRAATGRSLLSNGYIGADLLQIPAGEGFAPHTHPGDHLLFVLGGQGTITVDGTIVATAPGQAYMIEGKVPHAVGAISDHVILAIGAPHRPLDSMSRQELVEYASLLTPLGTIACQICGVTGSCGADLAKHGCEHSPHRYV